MDDGVDPNDVLREAMDAGQVTRFGWWSHPWIRFL